MVSYITEVTGGRKHEIIWWSHVCIGAKLKTRKWQKLDRTI